MTVVSRMCFACHAEAHQLLPWYICYLCACNKTTYVAADIGIHAYSSRYLTIFPKSWSKS